MLTINVTTCHVIRDVISCEIDQVLTLARCSQVMATPGRSDLYSQVELSISCSNLKDLDTFSKSDPVVFLFEKKGQQWIKIGRTEVIDDNLNPKVDNLCTIN